MAWGPVLLETLHRCKVAGMCPQGLHPQKKQQHTNSPLEADCQSCMFWKQRSSVSNINMAVSSAENKLRTENRQDVAKVKTKNFIFGLHKGMENVTTEEELFLHKDKQT